MTSLNPSPALPEIHFHMVNNQTPVVSSLDIARHFQRKHKEVLRDINKIISITPKSFNGLNFAPVDYTDIKGEKRPAYNLTRDAFSLLVMGFTGAAALRWKLRYIEAFNAIEQAALTQYAELARDAGYAQGVKEAQSAPALQIAQRQAYLDGLTEGKGEAAKLATAPAEILALPPKKLSIFKKAMGYATKGLTNTEIALLCGSTRREVSHLTALARRLGLVPAYVRPENKAKNIRKDGHGTPCPYGKVVQFALSAQPVAKPLTVIQGAAHA